MEKEKFEKIISKYLNLIEQEISLKKYQTGFDIRNIEEDSIENDNFRQVLYTGSNMQLVVMSLNPKEDIGSEIHKNVDQFFRIEEGVGEIEAGESKERIPIKSGSSILIQAGTRHNIINSSDSKKLKLYTIYAPPNHPDGTIHKTKEDAIAAEKEKK